METKIIYIAGYGRSGSTLLDIVLSNSENGFTLGEISNVFNERTKITDKFYADILNQTVNSLNLTESEIKKIKLSDRSYYKYNTKYRAFWNTFIKKIKEARQLSFLVDSSKTTQYTIFRPYNLYKSGFNISIIFLKASYIKVWKSALKGCNKSLQNNKDQNKKYYLFAVKSVISKLLTDIITKIIYENSKYMLVKINYEDFISDPLMTIKFISNKFQIDFENLDNKIKQNEFIVKGGYLGNRMRKKDTYIKIKKSD